MNALFATGSIVDLILGLMVLEAVVLVAHGVRTGRGVAPGDLLSSLVPGIFLLLALRGALVAAWWGWIALCLSAALLAHLSDLRRRWRRPRQRWPLVPRGPRPMRENGLDRDGKPIMTKLIRRRP